MNLKIAEHEEINKMFSYVSDFGKCNMALIEVFLNEYYYNNLLTYSFIYLLCQQQYHTKRELQINCERKEYSFVCSKRSTVSCFCHPKRQKKCELENYWKKK